MSTDELSQPERPPEPRPRVLERPLVWLLLSGASALLACLLPESAPDWLFWGAVAVSALAAALWAVLAPPNLDE